MRRRLTRVLIFLLLLLGLPLAVWRLYLAHVINHQLAAIRAAGLPTNGEELNRWYPRVADNQNAALVMTQAFALRRIYPDTRSNLIFNFKLPKRAEAMSPEQVELLQGYTAMNEARLRKANEALQLPASRYPIDCSQLMSTPLPHLTWLKEIAELHQYAAFLAMASGNVPSATSNIVTILAVARTLDAEPCLISQLVRLGLIKMAFATLERRANAGSLNRSEIASLTAAFAQTRTANIAVRALIGERAMTIPYFRMTKAEAERLNPRRPGKDSPLPCYGPAILRLIGYYDLDYGSYLLGMSKAIEMLEHSPPENLRAGGYLAHVGEGSMQRQRLLSGVTLAAYAGAARRENEGSAMQRLALTALAIESFAKATGRFPETLKELTPNLLADLPEDPFTGLELTYRREEKGYVVYSVGPDLQDDGGLEVKESRVKPRDITFTVQRPSSP